MPKKRLDVLLTERNLAPSRERAKTMIMEGIVFVNGIREDKPGTGFDPERIRSLEVKGKPLPYVSRGGLKLEKAVRLWSLSFAGMTCLDIGASTGGFTDVMLQNGATRVYAVDSGSNQLDYGLRTDARVVCMEKTNFRYVTAADIPEPVDFAGADVSFISLTKILAPAHALLRPGARMVCLIKPQFEAGREKVGKKGVVRDAEVHLEVVIRVGMYAAENGFSVEGLSFSPVRGPEGNIEYLLLLRKDGDGALPRNRETDETRITEAAGAVVNEAHAFFRKEQDVRQETES
ncbi:MAG: TlyA family RNA methyltransferase [Lachnospiraceae bacterium]|nr:TlyA family RNA methyltransferase [Lachnospiraceae bacterium]